MEDLQSFLDLGSKAIFASIFATIALVMSLLLCMCLENKNDSRPKYMGCRPLTEEEMFGPVEQPAVVVVVPPEIEETETVVEINSFMANGHISDSARNKTATLNRQLPEIPQAENDPHNTYESTSELYATLDDTYFKVSRGVCEPGPSTSPSLTLVEIYDPYSCVRDEVKSSKDYGKIKETNNSPIEQDGGYTKVLAENKKGSKKHTKLENNLQGKSTDDTSLPYGSASDLAPPVPDKNFDVQTSDMPEIIVDAELNIPSGQPVSFNIPMGMIDDTESMNGENIIQENPEDENSKELSYTKISVREPLANLKAKQFESYYSVVPEDDTYAQVDSATSITTTSTNTSAPINLYAEIEISSNSSGYSHVERNGSSLLNSEMPPAPPTVESLRSITIHSKEGGPEGPSHRRSLSETIDISQMYATVDKHKRNTSFERESTASPDQPGLDLNELKQMLESDHHNCRTPPFPMDLYENSGAKPKNFKAELSTISKLNGFREDMSDSGYETVLEVKSNHNDETYDNLDKNYRIKNTDPLYNIIPMTEEETKKEMSFDPEYETVLDAIVSSDLLDSIKSGAEGQNLTSFITESYYETVEQKCNDPNYETIRTHDSTPPLWIRPINNEQNSDGYESVESLNISRYTEKRLESLYDNGYESINRLQANQVPNGPISNTSVHSINSTASINQTMLPGSSNTYVNNHTTDRNIVQEDFKDR